MVSTDGLRYRIVNGVCEITGGIDFPEVAIPSSIDGFPVRAIAERAFMGMRDLRALHLPESLRVIGDKAFAGCINLTFVSGFENIQIIMDKAFIGCIRLQNAAFGKSLSFIGDKAFKSCRSIRFGSIPMSLTFIGEGAFEGCSGVGSFRVSPRSSRFMTENGCLIDINERAVIAFPAGSSRHDVRIPEGIEIVKPRVFSECPNVWSIRLSSTVREFPWTAVAGCSNLSEIYVDEGSQHYSASHGILYTHGFAEMVKWPEASTEHVAMINFGCVSIGPGAFRDCRNIDILRFSDRLKIVNRDAFGGNTRPRSIQLRAGFDAKLPFLFTDCDGKPMEGQMERDSFFELSPDGTFRLLKADDPVKERHLESRRRMNEKRFEPVEIDGVMMEDIAGNEQAKEDLYTRVVLPSERPDLFDEFGLRFGGGVLLYGPPGTGKTMLAKAVAAQRKAKFFSVGPSDLFDKFVGESEARIRALFETARANAPAVIFFDDLDGIASKRNGRESWRNSMMSELLTQIQGLGKSDADILVMGATNRPWDIDSALMRSGRFDSKIHVGLPDEKARAEIFRMNLAGVPCDRLDIPVLVSQTEGYNCADIVEICLKAKRFRVSEIAKGATVRTVTMDDMKCAIALTPSSVDACVLAALDRYRKGLSPFDADTPNEGKEYVPSDRPIAGYQ